MAESYPNVKTYASAPGRRRGCQAAWPSLASAMAMATPDPGPRLLGRRSERAALDRLVETVRAGPSAVLVLRGEAGVGKSALLEYVAHHAPGCTVARATGVESEMELAFAGLHQLCAP